MRLTVSCGGHAAHAHRQSGETELYKVGWPGQAFTDDYRSTGTKLIVLLLREVLMATGDVPSLYERLGGVYSIATVIDDFIDRIMVDPRLNAKSKG
jgi:hypothetical protein